MVNLSELAVLKQEHRIKTCGLIKESQWH